MGPESHMMDKILTAVLSSVIPISSHQDTVGPMTRSVADAAIILSVLAGQDERDNYTLAQPSVVPNYTLALRLDGLEGVRLGVPRKRFVDLSDDIVAAFNASLDTMRALGATIVDPADLVNHDEFEQYRASNESLVTDTDLKVHSPLLECIDETDAFPHRSSSTATLRDYLQYLREYEMSRISLPITSPTQTKNWSSRIGQTSHSEFSVMLSSSSIGHCV